MTVPLAQAPAAGAARESSDSAAVRLDGVTKRFPVRRGWLELLRHPRGGRTVTVLRDVTCDIRDGEFFGLLGPNGAGKTTLFKLLATLVVPDAGRATVLGHDVVRDASKVRRLLSPVIADERSLHWRLSARENLRLYAALHGVGDDASSRRVEELLGTVGLAMAGDAMVGTFSSGMKQRLLIARALLAQPRVLLLDEPTRSLDPVSARAFRAFLREEISLRHRCTVLLATHNAEEALELCDRVAILDRGRLLAVGAADALARELGDERYQLWTTTPSHPVFAAVTARGSAAMMAVGDVDAEGWTRISITIHGGPARAAQVLAFLTGGGATIARFERVRLDLADLIERVVERHGAETDHA